MGMVDMGMGTQCRALLYSQFNHMGPKHNKFQLTSFTCGIINKAHLACEALDVTCLKLKEVYFGGHMWKVVCMYIRIHHYVRGVGYFFFFLFFGGRIVI